MFSCEFCEIFKNTYFYRTPLLAASGSKLYSQNIWWYPKKVSEMRGASVEFNFDLFSYWCDCDFLGVAGKILGTKKNYLIAEVQFQDGDDPYQDDDQFDGMEQHSQVESYRACLTSCPRRCSVKQVFLKISQYSQENTCVEVSF